MAVKLYADSECEIKYLQKSSLEIRDAFVTEDIVPESLSTERQQYLYDQIRQLSDLVAPKPTIQSSKALANKTSEIQTRIPTIVLTRKNLAQNFSTDEFEEEPKHRRGRPRKQKETK